MADRKRKCPPPHYNPAPMFGLRVPRPRRFDKSMLRITASISGFAQGMQAMDDALRKLERALLPLGPVIDRIAQSLDRPDESVA